MIQALWRGAKIRENLRVSSLCRGLVLVEISGDQEFFAKIGLACAFYDSLHIKKQHIAYLAVDQAHFSGQIFSNDGLLNPLDLSKCLTAKHSLSTRGAIVFINGGFFNYEHRSSDSLPEHAPIGRTLIDNKEIAQVQLPDCYAEDFQSLEFEDGSLLQSAPLLSTRGNPVFTYEKLHDPKYHLEEGFSFEKSFISPGVLKHAANLNPRAAISIPNTFNTGQVRLTIGTADEARGNDANSGFSLASWAKVMARIDRLSGCPESEVPNSSTNLDGGGSVSLIVIRSDKPDISLLQSKAGRTVANFISFVER